MSAAEALAAKWRKLALAIQGDLRGSSRGSMRFKPTGVVKARMQTQAALLLSCARELEEIT